MFTAFLAQYWRFLLLISAQSALALPHHLLSTLADKSARSLVFQFSYSCWVWNPLLLLSSPCYMVILLFPFIFNYMHEQPGSQATARATFQVCIASEQYIRSITSANCSSLKGAVIQGPKLFGHTTKASSKPGATIPESLVLTPADLKTPHKNLSRSKSLKLL